MQKASGTTVITMRMVQLACQNGAGALALTQVSLTVHCGDLLLFLTRMGYAITTVTFFVVCEKNQKTVIFFVLLVHVCLATLCSNMFFCNTILDNLAVMLLCFHYVHFKVHTFMLNLCTLHASCLV